MTHTPGEADQGAPDAVGGDDSGFQGHFRAARTEFESQVAHARDQFEEANERIKARTGRDLIVAIAIALAIGGVLLVSLLFVKWLFLPFALAVAVVGTFEIVRAFQGVGRRVDLVPLVVGAGALVVVASFATPGVTWVAVFVAVAVAVLWRLVAQMAAQDGRTYADVLSDVLSAVLVILYVPFPTTFAVMLLREPEGEWWVLAFLIVAVSADTAAYASGLAFGKHPMAPRISPKKTWEGFAGAVVASLVAGALLAWLMLGIPWYWGLPFGVVILFTATLGDLGESMLKRDLGIKDMSSWLPGHGGVLDRLDSILPSAPAAFALFLLLSPLAVS